MPDLSARLDRIVGSATVGISNLAAKQQAAGKDIVKLSMGEPDFPTPAHVVEAAKAALDDGHTKYTPGPGIPELRSAVATRENADNGIPCTPEDVLVTPAKHAMLMSILAVADQGDDVLLPDPGWVSYGPMTQWAHARPVPVALDDEFRMTAEAVAEAITPDSTAIVLNSPSNPTGGVNTPDDVRGIVELAADHDLWVISDELYQKLIYEGEHLSPASVDGAYERTITVNGLSKAYSMTGWRIGWLVAPEPVRKQIGKLQGHSVTHCTSFAQYGAVAALEGPQDSVDSMWEAFLARRSIMVDGLRELGVECATPHGAFYVFPEFGGDDEALCMELIDKAGVAGTPGGAFGEQGRGHIRFSYATSEDRLREALDRLGAYLA